MELRWNRRKNNVIRLLGVGGWTIIDTTISLLVFTIVLFIVFLLVNKLSGIAVYRGSQFSASTEGETASVLFNRLIGSAGLGVPVGSKVTESINSVSLEGYSETPADFSVVDGYPKIIDGNNDSKNGFGYLVVRTALSTLSLPTLEWAIVKSDGSGFTVIATSDTPPESGDCVTLISTSDQSNYGTVILKNNLSLNATGDFSDYGLPKLPVGRYEAFSVLTDANSVCENPYNRVDIVLTKKDLPDYCADGTYNLSLSSVNPEDGSLIFMPVIRCVSDFKVKFLACTSSGCTWLDSIRSLSVSDVQKEIKAVALFYVYQGSSRQSSIVTQDCSRDAYIYTNSGKVGYTFDFSNSVPDCKHYKWLVGTNLILIKNRVVVR